MKMKGVIILSILALLIITGCSKQQPYTGYASYAPQGGGQQAPPVASGCGVIAPAEVLDSVDSGEISSAL